MDRFFSKLDLRDIKIKPEGNRFLPDDDAAELVDERPDARVSIAEPNHASDTPDPIDIDPAPMNGHAEPVYDYRANGDWGTDRTSERSAHRIAESDVDDLGNGSAEVLKVSAKSRPSAVAGAIAGVVRENGRAEVQAIGAGATNQAIKAIAIAREYLLETEIEAICVPAFIDVRIDNEERTAIRLVIETR